MSKTKGKANSIVITAHGRINKEALTHSPPFPLITTCKLGETHHGAHLNFNDLSIFTNKHFLNNYILSSSDDYTNQGEVIMPGTPMPTIFLTPCSSGESIKRWSWQKPHVIEHLKKMCIYELKDLPGNPYSINYQNITGITNTIPLHQLQGFAEKSLNFKLKSHVNILVDYNNNMMVSSSVNLDTNHMAGLSYMPQSGIYIFDYEIGPSVFTGDKANDLWPLPEAIGGVVNYCNNNSIDVIGADYILKACLE